MIKSIDFRVEPGTHVEIAVMKVRELHEKYQCNVCCMFNFLPLSIWFSLGDKRTDKERVEEYRKKDKEFMNFGDYQNEGAYQ